MLTLFNSEKKLYKTDKISMVNNDYEIKLDTGKWVDLTLDQKIILNDAIGRKANFGNL